MHTFDIAVGKSRYEAAWKSEKWTWPQFIERIKSSHRTSETLQDYLNAPSDRQAEIKDVGGFVGGTLVGGRRSAHSVISRSLITLDADNAQQDFWEIFQAKYAGIAAALYSTHKHTTEKPRFRLIIPLSRDVLADEYIPICRKIAEHIGIDQFDYTGYQANRLMYWPSTSKDGEYIFKEQQGALLDPDLFLKTFYSNWQDVSQWPISTSENGNLTRHAQIQGHPHDKPGLIGAFNKAYSISEAIETFLNEVYVPAPIRGRYTFTGSSTASGVIVYDDLFSYSHHSTDPASGILCNSFDLVRLHKFGLQDSLTDKNIPVNKTPSYLAMCDFVAKDKKIIKAIGEAKVLKAIEAFKEVQPGETPAEDLKYLEQLPNSQLQVAENGELKLNTEWTSKLDIDRKGNILPTIHNFALIIQYDPLLNIKYDTFKSIAIFAKQPPWTRNIESYEISDFDLDALENYIEVHYKLSGSTKFMKGFNVALNNKAFNPVQDYLKSLRWDGVERVKTLFTKYLGADNSEYVQEVTVKSLVACCARAMTPGIKFDNIVTFVGEEGQGKSTLLDKLGQQWFSDTFSLHMLQTKEGYEQLQGVWLIEIGELSGMGKVEVERVKNFVSARKDRFRPPYGRSPQDKPRQCVFFAGTNDTQFLRSQTGNRRFWPVRTGVVEPENSAHKMTQIDIDQIWAEAFALYKKGTTLFLSKEIEAVAKSIQAEHTEVNPLVDEIETFLSYNIPEAWYNMTKWEKIDFIANYEQRKTEVETFERTCVCAYEIWDVLMQKKDKLDTYNLKQIKQAMSKIPGWSMTKDLRRFGNYYPRHRGSWEKTILINNLL